MRVFTCAGWMGVLGLAAVPSPASAQAAFAGIVDHVHIAAPDPAKAVEWYATYFGGEKTPEGPDRVIFGDTRLIVQKREPTPSAGSVLNDIGFSVDDLTAAMRLFEALGVTIVQPARDLPGLYRSAIVEDPWGSRVEIVQDSQKRGLHHVHLQAPDPAATLGWFADKFGQPIGKLKGQLDGINYRGVWLLAQRGDSTPSPGHSIDHIGFRPLNVDTAVLGLKAKNVTVVTEPRPLTLPSGTSMRLAFIEGPDGVRIELVQRQ